MLGTIYYQGILSIEKNDKKSAEWYQKAVAGGHVYAMNNLANLYDHGWGVEKNPEKAQRQAPYNLISDSPRSLHT